MLDGRTAPVVRRIFTLRCAGMGYGAIAHVLNEEHILTPSAAMAEVQGRESVMPGSGLWTGSVIMKLLRNEVYIGNMVQGKTGTLSFRNRKLIGKPEEEWIRVGHTHAPIIEQSIWDRVQELGARRHRTRRTERGANRFAGLLWCANCGSAMRMQVRTHKSGETVYYLCGSYSRRGKNTCRAHVIREQVLLGLVVADIQRHVSSALDEPQRLERITARVEAASGESLALYNKQRNRAEARTAELQKIIGALYEDRVNAVIPIGVFQSLLEKYERERGGRIAAVEALRERIAVAEQEKCADIPKDILVRAFENPDAAMLLALIDRIEIGHSEIGGRICDVRIHYRFMVDNGEGGAWANS